MTNDRYLRLKQILEDRRQRLQRSLSARLDEIRAHGDGKVVEGLDAADASAADLDQAFGVALVEMASEALCRVDQALSRLEQGEYGVCTDCDTPIAGKRLQALPFALRCRACEELRESSAQAYRSSVRSLRSRWADEPLRLTAFESR